MNLRSVNIFVRKRTKVFLGAPTLSLARLVGHPIAENNKPLFQELYPLQRDLLDIKMIQSANTWLVEVEM